MYKQCIYYIKFGESYEHGRRGVLRGLWLTDLNCKRFLALGFIYPPLAPKDDTAPEELLSVETSFASFVGLIQSLAGSLRHAAPWERLGRYNPPPYTVVQGAPDRRPINRLIIPPPPSQISISQRRQQNKKITGEKEAVSPHQRPLCTLTQLPDDHVQKIVPPHPLYATKSIVRM